MKKTHIECKNVTKSSIFNPFRYVTSTTVKSSWGHPGEAVTNLDISYLVVFTLQIVCDAILVWGALKKIPNHLVPWLWANAVIIAVFLVRNFLTFLIKWTNIKQNSAVIQWCNRQICIKINSKAMHLSMNLL